PSIIGSRIVRNYFTIGELGPTTLIVAHPKLNFRTPEGRAAIDALSRKIEALEGVAEVRSVALPLGRRTEAPAPASPIQRLSGGFQKQIIQVGADPRYVSTGMNVSHADRDHITRLDIVFKTDPFAVASFKHLVEVRKVVAD